MFQKVSEKSCKNLIINFGISPVILELAELRNAATSAEARWSFLRSQRGAPLILHCGFVYRCERQISRRTYWLCIRYKGHKCNSRLILSGNNIIKETSHNHLSDERSNELNIEFKNLDDQDVPEWIKGLVKLKPEKT